MNHHIPSTHDERLAGLEARMAAVEFREIEDREALRHHKEHTFAPLAGKRHRHRYGNQRDGVQGL